MDDRQRAKYASHLALRHLCRKETSRALTSSLPAQFKKPGFVVSGFVVSALWCR